MNNSVPLQPHINTFDQTKNFPSTNSFPSSQMEICTTIPVIDFVTLENDIPSEKEAIDVAWDFASMHFSVIPLDPEGNHNPNLLKYLSNSTKFSPDKILDLSQNFHNFGVVTGRSSINLFVVRCYTENSYETALALLEEKVNWITKSNNYWDLWFICFDGMVSNSDFIYDAEILGHQNIILIPGCTNQHGTISKWIKRDTFFPTILHSEDMKKYFRDVMVTPMRKKLEEGEVFRITQVSTNNGELNQFEKAELIGKNYRFGKGKTGTNKRLLYKALVDRAKKENPNEFRATIRELEILTQISYASIVKYLGEFQDLGLIKLNSRSATGNKYRLCLNRNFYITNSDCYNDIKVAKFLIHDVWSSRGLGSCSKAIMEYLLQSYEIQNSFSAKDISHGVGISLTTTYKKINELNHFRLLSKQQGKWTVDFAQLNSVNLDNIAKELGASGSVQRRRNRIDRQRQEYCLRLARRPNSQS